MSTGHSVIPIDEKQLGDKGIVEYLKSDLVFLPENIPFGRFPTLIELRHTIQELGYKLEETQDWYVTSEDDFTEIWFGKEDSPNEFWFRRGANIVWNITQSLANRCGSIAVMNHSGSPTILFVPETVFSPDAPIPPVTDYFQVMTNRLPTIVERLPIVSTDDKLFLLSQIRQAARSTEQHYQFEFFTAVQQNINTFKHLLGHEDARIRYMAFDLIAKSKERFYETADALKSSIQSEPDTATKTRMIYGLEKLIVPGWIGGEIYQPIKGILEVLSDLNNNDKEANSVRLATAHLLVRSQPGLLTPAIKEVFISTLAYPEQYETDTKSAYSINDDVLKSIETMLLNHRIEILITALPNITIVQYAHEVVRALLDQIFFGATRHTQRSSLPETHLAERPTVGEAKFDINLPRNWLYPANPTPLTNQELSPTQRKVLETVIALDTPWMVHSNLLEKYGLPPTRAAVRALLDTST